MIKRYGTIKLIAAICSLAAVFLLCYGSLSIEYNMGWFERVTNLFPFAGICIGTIIHLMQSLVSRLINSKKP